MKDKRTVPKKYREKYCASCIWQTKGLCPFLRCPRVNGWVSEKLTKEDE